MTYNYNIHYDIIFNYILYLCHLGIRTVKKYQNRGRQYWGWEYILKYSNLESPC